MPVPSYLTAFKPASRVVANSYTRRRYDVCLMRLAGNVDDALRYEAEAGEILAAHKDDERFASFVAKFDDAAAAADPKEAFAALFKPATEDFPAPSKEEYLDWQVFTYEQWFKNKALTSDDRVRLTEMGCPADKGWGWWVLKQADKYGVEPAFAAKTFNALGPSGAFDSFIAAIKDGE